MAFARDRTGRTARAGGWGYLLGDEGSGYALVLAGLQAVARAADGRGPGTSLTEGFLAKLNLAQADQFIAAVYRGGLDRTALAALAPVVFEAAGAGDAVATAIVAQGAQQLADLVAAAIGKVALEQDSLPLALSGGVLLAAPTYRHQVVEALRSRGIRPDPLTPVREPAEGAVRLALAQAGPGA
jgi:N-acetylglucosamine kinase-like BadF-type ATPase